MSDQSIQTCVASVAPDRRQKITIGFDEASKPFESHGRPFEVVENLVADHELEATERRRGKRTHREPDAGRVLETLCTRDRGFSNVHAHIPLEVVSAQPLHENPVPTTDVQDRACRTKEPDVTGEQAITSEFVYVLETVPAAITMRGFPTILISQLNRAVREKPGVYRGPMQPPADCGREPPGGPLLATEGVSGGQIRGL